MATAGNATPLISLDAVVIDTETTGLDPAKARIVEIAAVPLKSGKLDEAGAVRRLVNPGEPIPPTATGIHHIDDAMVANASVFAAAWPDFAKGMQGAILIGHSIGFDLAVLKRECDRAGLAWTPPRTLCTRLLSQVAEPRLAGYTLEHLADWLGVDLQARHSALGDATLTAKIFLALLPKLRERNIRTLAEAEKACLALTKALDEEHQAGWAPAVTAFNAQPDQIRIDTYPYRHRVADVMTAPVKFIARNIALGDALKTMEREKISSLLVASDARLPVADTGIVTERDILRALAAHGAEALALPVETFASKPLAALPSAAFVYRALGRLHRLKLRHLAVENERHEVCGIISARDLLRFRAQEAAILGDAIDEADDVHALGAAWARLPLAAEGLVAEGVSGRDIAAVISRELGALTRRAGVLAERRLKAEGRGDPPCRYALCVLGSAGRGESLLAMDQDNAIVFEEGEPGSTADRWFARLGEIVADMLHEVGVPYCSGGVMAKNDAWRGSLATWRARVASWFTHSKPADLMSVDIFFDLLAVHGDTPLANTIWREAFDAAHSNRAFAMLLGEAGGETRSVFNLWGGIRTEAGRVDLKRAGLFGIVTLARVLAIRYRLLERATPARLAAAAALGRGGNDLDMLNRVQGEFLDLILRQQLTDIRAGRPPSNKIDIKTLTREQSAEFRSALGAVVHLDTLMRDLLS